MISALKKKVVKLSFFVLNHAGLKRIECLVLPCSRFSSGLHAAFNTTSEKIMLASKAQKALWRVWKNVERKILADAEFNF